MKKELGNMDSFERKIDQAFEQKLRERFEDFQAPDKAGLSEKIFESIRTRPGHWPWVAGFGVVLLVMLALPAGLLQKKLPVSRHKETFSKLEKIKFADSSKDWKAITARHSPQNSYKPNASVSENLFIPETASRKSAAILTDSALNSASVRAEFNANLLSGRGLHFTRLALPGITFVGTSVTNESKSIEKSSPFIPVLCVTGLQQFQLVNLHSDSEMAFQNVRFAPLLNTRSTGYKVSVGAAKGSLQLLLSYGNLRNWSYYELGTSRIKISPTSPDQYVQRRDGIPGVISEKLHLLGLSARSALPLNRTPLRGFATFAGLEFTAVLPDRSMMLWTNISSVKSFHLGKKTEIAVGPFAEYSLTQRSFWGGRWQSRPYRIGLTAEIKFPGK